MAFQSEEIEVLGKSLADVCLERHARRTEWSCAKLNNRMPLACGERWRDRETERDKGSKKQAEISNRTHSGSVMSILFGLMKCLFSKGSLKREAALTADGPI